MDQFPTTMYLGAGDFYRLLRLLLSPSCVIFALLSPFYWVKEYKRTHTNDRRATTLTKAVGVLGIASLVYLLASFLIAMTVLGIYSLII